MTLPNAERAVVDLRKLRDYILSPTHWRGRHKARVFESALGLASANAEELQKALLQAAKLQKATLGEEDAHGQRYIIEFELHRPNGRSARIRSGWIVRAHEDFPRFVTCYVL